MKRFRSLLANSVAITCLLAAATTAKADSLSIVLDEAYQSGQPGDTIAFNAIVTNTSSATENLNGDSFIVDSPLIVDDSPFLNNWPLTLGAGDSVTDQLLFNVDVPAGTPLGLYTGTFDITGGHYSTNEQFVIGSADFNVNVTPEPSSLWLLLSGMATLGATLRRRQLTR
jgi:PEP-CTERM motif